MLGHLRLARSRGSLQAPNSRVQDRALEILDMLDERRREIDRIDRVKELLTHIPADVVAEQFPEYFAADPFDGAYDPETGAYDPEKVDEELIQWGVAASKTEDDDLSAWIEEQERKNGGITTFTANEWQ
jgi:hypothetical protein